MIKKETCAEYFKRRLSEGWKCTKYAFPKAILSSPDGSIKREIDLRHDIITVRPSAPGSLTQLSKNGSSPAPTNWQSVDEAVADEGVTTVYMSEGTDTIDLYSAPVSEVPGTINKVRIFARARYIQD